MDMAVQYGSAIGGLLSAHERDGKQEGPEEIDRRLDEHNGVPAKNPRVNEMERLAFGIDAGD
jgi:hypothetical protein